MLQITCRKGPVWGTGESEPLTRPTPTGTTKPPPPGWWRPSTRTRSCRPPPSPGPAPPPAACCWWPPPPTPPWGSPPSPPTTKKKFFFPHCDEMLLLGSTWPLSKSKIHHHQNWIFVHKDLSSPPALGVNQSSSIIPYLGHLLGLGRFSTVLSVCLTYLATAKLIHLGHSIFLWTFT